MSQVSPPEQRACVVQVHELVTDHATKLVALQKDVERHDVAICDLKQVNIHQTNILQTISNEIITAKASFGTLVKVCSIGFGILGLLYTIHWLNVPVPIHDHTHYDSTPDMKPIDPSKSDQKTNIKTAAN